jgi:hypothetical protein
MSWWIFIHFYLWQNRLRRWWEQPLSLLSKWVVAGLLGLLGAFVILGLKDLGAQLDARLQDREALAVIISETVPGEVAAGELAAEEAGDGPWRTVGGEVVTFLQAAAFAELDDGRRVPVVAVENLEQHGMVDDFYLLTGRTRADEILEFQIERYRSEARCRKPSEDARFLLNNREALVGGVARLSGLLAGGFTRTMVLHARSVEDIQQAHDIADALFRVEGKRIVVRSNLRILREIGKVRAIQAQSLIWVTLGSSVVLGLVFGSLAWMEFREERFLLALIRTFGAGRWSLLAHALMENCLLAVSGVLLGFGLLHFAAARMNLAALNMTWLKSSASLYGGEGRLLLLGAAAGGVLACVPVAIGLRRPLGLVLR